VRVGLVILSVCAAFAPAAVRGQDLAVEYRNTFAIPSSATDQSGLVFAVTGLSGLSYAGDNLWWACLDNSNKLIELRITLGAMGDIAAATITRGLSLGTSADAEDLAVSDGHAWIADESPALRRAVLASAAIDQNLALPPPFTSVRPNFGLESLTRAADGVHWTANEEALSVDGPLSTPQAGTLVRLLRLAPSGESLTPTRQLAYETAPIHGPTTAQARSGLCALVALPSGRMLSLERSFALNFASLFQSRIYELDLAGAGDVGHLASLVTPTPIPPIVPVGKRLLHRAFHANMEGLALGPPLANGGHALLGIVDDGDPLSTNQLVAFRLAGPVEPPCPADIDADGDADSDDIIAFFIAWEEAAPPADLDGDADTDSDDVVVFFTAFEGGC